MTTRTSLPAAIVFAARGPYAGAAAQSGTLTVPQRATPQGQPATELTAPRVQQPLVSGRPGPGTREAGC